MRLAIPRAGALVRGLIVNRLPRIMSNVNSPIREPRNALRETRPTRQILLRLADIDELGGGDRLRLVSFTRRVPTTTPGNECGTQKSYRDETHSRKYPGRLSRGWRRRRGPRARFLSARGRLLRRQDPRQNGQDLTTKRTKSRWSASQRHRHQPGRDVAVAVAGRPRGQCPSPRRPEPPAAWPPPHR